MRLLFCCFPLAVMEMEETRSESEEEGGCYLADGRQANVTNRFLLSSGGASLHITRTSGPQTPPQESLGDERGRAGGRRTAEWGVSASRRVGVCAESAKVVAWLERRVRFAWHQISQTRRHRMFCGSHLHTPPKGLAKHLASGRTAGARDGYDGAMEDVCQPKHRAASMFHPPCLNALRVDETVRRRFSKARPTAPTSPVNDAREQVQTVPLTMVPVQSRQPWARRTTRQTASPPVVLNWLAAMSNSAS